MQTFECQASKGCGLRHNVPFGLTYRAIRRIRLSRSDTRRALKHNPQPPDVPHNKNMPYSCFRSNCHPTVTLEHTMRHHVFFRQWGNSGLVERYSMRVHIQQARPLPMALKYVTVWHMTPNGPKEAAGLPTSLLWTTNRSIVKALLTYQVQGIIGRGGEGVV